MIIEIIIFIFLKIIKKKKFKKQQKKKENINRGEYLTILGNCVSCHTIAGGKPFSGGNFIKTKFGIISTPNITSNKKYGLGKIKFKNFKNIIKKGTKNNFLYPAFPYQNYSNIKKDDLKNILKFLKNTSNDNIINKKNNIKFLIKYKKFIFIWRTIFFKIKKYKKIKKSNIKRGKYISKAFCHCDMCHNKINAIGKINYNFKYKGKNEIEGWECKNINNENYGIKKIKNKEIKNILKNGISKEKNICGSMIEVINNSTQYINKIDIDAISKYIKSKINLNKIINFKKKIKIKYKKKKNIYKYECKVCHGKYNLGNFPIYPKLIKKNIYKIKKIKNILKKNSSINTIKNKFPSIMKIFKKIKIKNLEKYIKIINKLKK